MAVTKCLQSGGRFSFSSLMLMCMFSFLITVNCAPTMLSTSRTKCPALNLLTRLQHTERLFVGQCEQPAAICSLRALSFCVLKLQAAGLRALRSIAAFGDLGPQEGGELSDSGEQSGMQMPSNRSTRHLPAGFCFGALKWYTIKHRNSNPRAPKTCCWWHS